MIGSEAKSLRYIRPLSVAHDSASDPFVILDRSGGNVLNIRKLAWLDFGLNGDYWVVSRLHADFLRELLQMDPVRSKK